MDNDYDIVMDNLSEDTCWRMLARARFGRVAYLDGDEPVALPVNAGVYERQIIFRTAMGSGLARHAEGTKVAFEADHTDPIEQGGWSVLVRGRLWDVTDSAEVEGWKEFDVHPWAPPPRDRWMLIEPTSVTGRAIERHRKVGRGTREPYMEPD
jgi:nitroimidazol reductase NimA-like FMN-containing flavoprotein (pyridoxamine 5'-phosphate oxidase superfamily)